MNIKKKNKENTFPNLICKELPVLCVPIQSPLVECCEVRVDDGHMTIVQTEPYDSSCFEDIFHTT